MSDYIYSIDTFVGDHCLNAGYTNSLAKECIPFSYEKVLEHLMRTGLFSCKVYIPFACSMNRI